MSKWVRFDDVTLSYPNSEKKTCTWNVYSKNDIFFLGKIKWYSYWRQYCFYPSGESLYNQECLRDIADFMKENRQTRNPLFIPDTAEIDDYA